MQEPRQPVSRLTAIRLCLSGAIAGAALVGAVGPMFGIDVSHAKEVLGGVLGASVVVAFRFAHVI